MNTYGTPALSTTSESFRAAGIDFTTKLEDIFYQGDLEGLDWGEEASDRNVVIPNFKMHVRCDTGEQLGMVSDGYKPFENSEMADFIDALQDANPNVSLESCGSTDKSRRIFALLEMPTVVEAVPGDEIKTYILVSNGHGGKASFMAHPLAIRSTCNNALNLTRESRARYSFRHTGDTPEKLERIMAFLSNSADAAKLFQTQVTALVEKQMSSSDTVFFLMDVYKATNPSMAELDADEWEKAQEKRFSTLCRWNELVENDNNTIPGIEGSLWGVFNAITEWQDHERGRSASDSQARQNSNLFGVSAQAKAKAFDMALALV